MHFSLYQMNDLTLSFINSVSLTGQLVLPTLAYNNEDQEVVLYVIVHVEQSLTTGVCPLMHLS